MQQLAPGRMTEMRTWQYEPDENPKRKHHWDKDHAGFVKVGPNRVGKCPATMNPSDVQALLDDAIPYVSPRWSRSYPPRLYAVSGGVVYRAAPTNPGTSYHGFPEHPSTFPRGGNARDVKNELLERATQQGCEREVRRWMNW